MVAAIPCVEVCFKLCKSFVCMAVPSALPRLPFGELTVRPSHDLAVFLAAQRTAMTGLRRYEPLDRGQPFAYKSATLRLGSLRLAASSSTPVAVASKESRETTLLIPFHGWSSTVIDGRTYRWQAGESAMFVPGSERSGESSVRSTLAITFEPEQLEETARGMAGSRHEAFPDLQLDRPRLVSLRGQGGAAMRLLQRVLTLIDIGTARSSGLRLHALDDMVYQVLAGMLAPTSLAAAMKATQTVLVHAVVDRVAEHITAHLQRPIPRSELEALVGLSARTLQIAFRSRFGSSTREWTQHRRLDLARERLLHPSPVGQVAEVALACGFTRLGGFAKAYSQRFGELPSATLARSQRRGPR